MKLLQILLLVLALALGLVQADVGAKPTSRPPTYRPTRPPICTPHYGLTKEQCKHCSDMHWIPNKGPFSNWPANKRGCQYKGFTEPPVRGPG